MTDSSSTEVKREDLLGYTSEITSAHVSNNTVALSDLPGLIEQIYNFVRALSYPYPGAFTFNENKKKIIINNCEISKLVIPGIKIGEVRKIRNYYFVKTKRGVIKIISFKGDLKNGQTLQ